jgi:CHASE2 domain-containing sensor protein
LSVLLAFFVQRQGLLFTLDAKIYDIGLSSRPAQAPENIVIAGLSDAFVGEHHVSQIPRDKLARLVEALTDARPAVIAIDVWLDSRVQDGAKRGDGKLRAALLRAQKAGVPVVLAQLSLEANPITDAGAKGTTAHGATIPFFAEAATAIGGVAFMPDSDKVVRLMPDETADLPSLPYLTAWHSLKNVTARRKLESLRISNIQELRPLNFYGSPDLQNTQSKGVPLHDAQKIINEPYLAPFLAGGKIVFIGATFPRSTDLFQSPYNNVGAKRKFYGVELLANATWAYLQGASRNQMRLSHENSAAQNKVLTVAALVAALVAGASLSGLLPGVLAVLFCSGAALWMGVVSAGSSAQSWPHFWPPSPLLTGALVAWITAAGWRQRVIGRELKQVREVFGGYVGKEVLDKLGGRLPRMGGETRDIAVLFCDIQGFSALAESLQNDPARVLQMLNEHFEPLVAALKNRGA